jgi:hypothetical protein
MSNSLVSGKNSFLLFGNKINVSFLPSPLRERRNEKEDYLTVA